MKNELRGVKQAMLSPVVQMQLRELNEQRMIQLLSLDTDNIDFKDNEILKLKDFLLSLYSSKEDMDSFLGDMFFDVYQSESNFIQDALIAILTPFSEEVFQLDAMHEEYVERARTIKQTFVLKELENLLTYGSAKKPRFNFVDFQNGHCLFDVFVNAIPQISMFTEVFKRQLTLELKLSCEELFYDMRVYDLYETRREKFKMSRGIKSMTRLRKSLKKNDVVNEYPKEYWLKMVKETMISNFGEGTLTDTMVLWSELAYVALTPDDAVDLKVSAKKCKTSKKKSAFGLFRGKDVSKEMYEFDCEHYGFTGLVKIFTNLTTGVKEITCHLESKYGMDAEVDMEEIHEDFSKNNKKTIKSKSLAVIQCFDHIDKRLEDVMRIRLSIEFK